ncbi:hypothetical protein M378DRAFT_170853 [Amanita muscaria Koide BX008]|uniref:Uncharacterized protein n=1 Tax=Amanita muscaria (strain Koide BX008) TaxID=946122 RepID=A0A0C2S637_AMAMK|nr:hypothetical protein M378DRAFT_170853 [Amanita muscaria Koide BX008]
MHPVAHLLKSFGALDRLEGFVSTFGRAFHQRPAVEGNIIVRLRRLSQGKMRA